MIENIKKVIKKIIKWDYLMAEKGFKRENFSLSLQELVKKDPDLLLEGRSVGKKTNDKPFSPAIDVNSYNFFAHEVSKYGDDHIKELSEYDNFQSGTPIKWRPFPLCIREIKKTIRQNNLYLYPSNTGNVRAKKKVLEYLIKEGFKYDEEGNYDGLSVNNIAFTCSTSQAYMMIIKLIAKENDVILVTGPNYGLFAIESERYGANVEILNLSEDDNWYVNPDKLAKRIDEINETLTKKYQNKSYIPRVVAFLNMNPHNPLGKVMSKKNKGLLEKIGDICLEKGVFVIDDLIYRDLTFDQDNLALPMATYPKYFNNTISLLGISKAYGLASFRAGVVVAPQLICRGINDQMYQNMVSMPVLQVNSVVGAFNGSKKRYRIFRSYFNELINEYQYRYLLFQALVEGIDSIQNNYFKHRIKNDIKRYLSSSFKKEEILKGIPLVSIRKKTVPEAGFFALLDFTPIRGKKTGEEVINNDHDLLKYLYAKGKIKFIMGMGMNWPEDEIIARVNFSLEKKYLINNLALINVLIKELK